MSLCWMDGLSFGPLVCRLVCRYVITSKGSEVYTYMPLLEQNIFLRDIPHAVDCANFLEQDSMSSVNYYSFFFLAILKEMSL